MIIDSPLPNWPALPTTGTLRLASQAVFSTWDRIAPGLPASGNVFDAYAMIRSMVHQPNLDTQEARFEFLQQTHWHMRWTQFGFPTFELTQGLASALMLTEVRGLRGADLHFPFDSFLIVLPNPTPLAFADMTGERPMDVKWLYVHRMSVPTIEKERIAQAHDNVQQAMKSTDAAVRLQAIEDARAIPTGDQTFIRLMSSDGLGIYDRDNWPRDDEPLEKWLEVAALAAETARVDPVLRSQDMAALRAATRLVVNLCCYINSLHGGLPAPDNQRRPSTKSTRKNAATPPTPKHWILGREIKLSKQMHEMARAFSNRRTSKAAYRLHARFMVRGHMRNQAYGTKHSERRMKWIKPHWKGPETADALARLYAVEPEVRRGVVGTAGVGGAGSRAAAAGDGGQERGPAGSPAGDARAGPAPQPQAASTSADGALRAAGLAAARDSTG